MQRRASSLGRDEEGGSTTGASMEMSSILGGSVEVSGNLFIRVADPEKAAYGARNPLYAVMMVRTIHLAERFFHPLRLTSYRNAFERQINIACAIGDEVSRFIDFCPIVSIGGFLKLLSEQVGDR